MRFNWQEVLNSSDISNLVSHFLSPDNPLKPAAETFQKVIMKNAAANAIPLVVDAVKILVSSGIQFSRFSAEQNKKLEKELKLRKWILEEAIKYKHLHKALKNNPRRIAWNYKLDNWEEIPWFGEITEIFNNKFNTNWTPVGVFSFVISGLLGLVFLGYWFISKVKSVVRNRRNASNTAQGS